MPLDVYKDWLGIPEGPRPPDHYALLRLVQFEDDAEKVRKNYRKLNGHVRKYATGQYSVQSQDLLNELAKAMLCLTDVDRKKEYDRSLGRQVADFDEESGRRPLTSYLQADGIISSAQAQEVKTYCEKTGLSPRDAVVQMKYANQEQATRALAAEYGRPFIDLNEVIPDDSVLDKMPRSVVRRQVCLPLFIDDDAVLVACAEEPSHDLEDEIRLRYGQPLKPVFATPLQINQCIAKYYAAGLRNEAPESTAATNKKGSSSSGGKPTRALSDEERQERKNLGIILINLTLVVLMNLDVWMLWDRIYKFYLPNIFSWLPLVSTVFVGIPICLVLFAALVKPNLK